MAVKGQSERMEVATQIISFREAAKSFDSRNGTIVALSEVSFDVEANQFVTIVGASGCGKSTLLNMLAGFEKPTTGEVLVYGQPVEGPGPDRGVVFQQTSLFPWLSVEDNIAFGLELRANRQKADRRAIVERFLKRTGLTGFRKRYPAELSGGMRQRAAIASVLAINPKILVMDEPFGALDSLTRSLMQDFLLELWETDRKTVVLVTHDIEEAIYLADRAVIMTAQPGRIREIIDIDLPRPRAFSIHGDPRFIALRTHITGIVREEASRSEIAVEAV